MLEDNVPLDLDLSKLKSQGTKIPPLFQLIKTCPQTGARVGVLHTPHGSVPTPLFLPVGSQGTVKAVTPDELREIGVGAVLANTYHLYLRPGLEVIQKLGADIIMPLDECPPFGESFDHIHQAMERSHLWAKRCQQSHSAEEQSLFG